jgi:hypothetical protein
MYLLFECGICSSLYQVQVEKFSNSLQKVVCPSCQSFHYFGSSQEISNTQTPSIEKVFNQNSNFPTLDSKIEQRTIQQELYWRCGVCETGYHFNLDRVTSQGIKVTCTTCFSFFVLQKVGIMVDLDHMVMHEVSPDIVLPSQLPPSERIMVPEIDINEVSGKFNMNTLQEEILKISTNKTKSPVVGKTANADAIFKPESSKPKMPPVPTFSMESSQPKIPPKSNPYVQYPSTRTNALQPEIKLSDKSVEIKPNDAAWVNSFKSLNTQRREFNLSPQVEVSSVTFLEDSPTRSKNIIEKNLSSISLWIAGVCILALAIVFAYDWYEARQVAKNPPPAEPVAPQETTLPNGSPKPQYGFPVLEE